jgi:hypothetical protein
MVISFVASGCVHTVFYRLLLALLFPLYGAAAFLVSACCRMLRAAAAAPRAAAAARCRFSRADTEVAAVGFVRLCRLLPRALPLPLLPLLPLRRRCRAAVSLVLILTNQSGVACQSGMWNRITRKSPTQLCDMRAVLLPDLHVAVGAHTCSVTVTPGHLCSPSFANARWLIFTHRRQSFLLFHDLHEFGPSLPIRLRSSTFRVPFSILRIVNCMYSRVSSA